MKNSHQYIEFVGVPGAGKTEAAKLFTAELQDRGEMAHFREGAGRSVFLKLWLFPRALFFLRKVPKVMCSDSFKDAPGVRTVIQNLRWRFAVEAVVVRHLLSQGALVNDEGLVGKVVALMTLAELSKEDAVQLLRNALPQKSVLVFVNVSIEIAMKREAVRDIELPFFNNLPPAAKHHFYTKSDELYRTFASWYGAGAVQVEYMENNMGRRELKENVVRLGSKV